MTHPYLTPVEVAALFRCDPQTVRRWVAKGFLEGVKQPGGRILIPRNQPALIALRERATGGADE